MAYEGEAARLLKLLRLLASPEQPEQSSPRPSSLSWIRLSSLGLSAISLSSSLPLTSLCLFAEDLLLRLLLTLYRAIRGARLGPKAEGPSDGAAAQAPRAASSEGLLSLFEGPTKKSAAF